jgi:glycosyltransferase involved in cell wall biosynthesis
MQFTKGFKKMRTNKSSIELASKLQCCVIIPTYNNSRTLQAVINDVRQYALDVIVVNDGSSDLTTDILASNPEITVIKYHPNQGKGYALKKGFKCAQSMGFRYAITIDSDGQHTAADIGLFLDKIELFPDSLIVGSRVLRQPNMPGGSTFANNFSNFWYRLQTGINLRDTQSGFRLYPLNKIKRIHFITNRYEGELEMLVRCAWQGINICAVAISVYYPPRDERVSHFRPFVDFFRISILNTFLTVIALVVVYPVKGISKLLQRTLNS